MSKHLIKFLLGPLLAILIMFIDVVPGNPEATKMAAVTVWVAVWWFTEAVHLSVTALLPFLLLPLLGILDTKTVASHYMDQVIFLFIGGFILAFAIERWNLHKRISLKILLTMGSHPSRVLAGVMLTSFFISMWISNTATVMMLISAVIAIIIQTDEKFQKEKDKIATALLLGLAYSASIGGMATIVGTPTNMIFMSFYNNVFPQAQLISFANWLIIGLPIAFALLIVCYFILKNQYVSGVDYVKIDNKLFKEKYIELGKWSYEEKLIGALFIITALLWFFRVDIDFGTFKIYGWTNLFNKPEYIQDSTVAILMAFILFFIPAKKEKRMLMTWEEAKKLPFGIILLFGSGFALAKGFEVSGLSNWLSGQLNFLNKAPLFLIILGICVLVTVLSEFTSNVASIQLVLPVLMALSKSLEIDPRLIMIPATFAASLGFMLPVATAPNTIVFGANRIHTKSMAKTGFLLDIIGIVIITTVMCMINRWV